MKENDLQIGDTCPLLRISSSSPFLQKVQVCTTVLVAKSYLDATTWGIKGLSRFQDGESLWKAGRRRVMLASSLRFFCRLSLGSNMNASFVRECVYVLTQPKTQSCAARACRAMPSTAHSHLLSTILPSPPSSPGHDHRRLLYRSIGVPSSSKQGHQLDRPTDISNCARHLWQPWSRRNG